MPLYEYECEQCAHRFEVIQKFSDPLVSVCPKCGGPVQKLLSSPAIQFKGSGFYLTDYGRGTVSKSDSSNTKTPKADAGATSGGDTSTTTTKDGGSGDAKSSSTDTSTSKPATPPAKTD